VSGDSSKSSKCKINIGFLLHTEKFRINTFINNEVLTKPIKIDNITLNFIYLKT
jgi:hypothetical protein